MKIEEITARLIDYRAELSEGEKAANTIKAYTADINSLTAWLLSEGERTAADELTKADVIAFKEDMKQQGVKPSTINRKVVSINKFLKWAGADEAAGTKQIHQQQKTSLENVLTLNEYERMLTAAIRPGKQARAAGLKSDPQAWAIMQTLAATGVRFGELKFFTVEALEAAPKNSNSIPIEHKGKIRKIPVCRDLQKFLKEYCKQRGIEHGYIFGTRNGTPIKNEQISKRLKRIAGYARINKDKIHPHNFRHLFAKSYMETVGRLDELKDILGHSSIATTTIYTKTSTREQAENTNRLGMIRKKKD